MTDAAWVRPPAVAGTFYSAKPDGLLRQIDESIDAEGESPSSFIAAVVPHAGLMYSGHVAGALYSRVRLPRRHVILCPNHTGVGTAASINLEGRWRTPLGDVPIDTELARAISERCRFVQDDVRAHAREHSLEIQLPFLQHLVGELTFVPLCLALPTFEHCAELGRAIAAAMSDSSQPGPIAILASTDLNHYENQETTLRKDQRAIDAILALDAAELWRRVRQEEISMCGYIPTCVAIIAAKELGATKARLVRHATSGDINGDYSGVVGYCSIIIS